MDFGAALFASGLSLAERLIVSWIEKGRSRVRVAEVESSITNEAKKEAERLRLRLDDLERVSRDMLREIVARTPELSYSRHITGPAIEFDFNPKDPASSKQMLTELRSRVQEISAGLVEPQLSDSSDTPRVIIDPPVGTDDQADGPVSRNRSVEMLEELRARVRRAEGDRR